MISSTSKFKICKVLLLEAAEAGALETWCKGKSCSMTSVWALGLCLNRMPKAFAALMSASSSGDWAEYSSLIWSACERSDSAP